MVPRVRTGQLPPLLVMSVSLDDNVGQRDTCILNTNKKSQHFPFILMLVLYVCHSPYNVPFQMNLLFCVPSDLIVCLQTHQNATNASQLETNKGGPYSSKVFSKYPHRYSNCKTGFIHETVIFVLIHKSNTP